MRFFGKNNGRNNGNNTGKNNQSRLNPSQRRAADNTGHRPALEALEDRVLFSAAGQLDAAFGHGGLAVASSTLSKISAAHAAVQADGKVVVVGKADDAFAVARFNADGTLDASFGASGTGIVLTQAGPDGNASQATSVAIQSDGRIVVVGKDSGFERFDVVRYRANGTLDTTFGGSGIVHTNLDDLVGFFSGVVGENAADVAVQSDGKIVVAGTAAVHGF